MLEEGEAFFEVERGVDVECHAKLHDGERNVGLNTDDDGDGTAEAGHVSEVAQRTGAEGVEHVECSDVDDDALGPVSADLLDEVFLESDELGVVQGGVDRGDEEVSLSENRDEYHRRPASDRVRAGDAEAQ